MHIFNVAGEVWNMVSQGGSSSEAGEFGSVAIDQVFWGNSSDYSGGVLLCWIFYAFGGDGIIIVVVIIVLLLMQ